MGLGLAAAFGADGRRFRRRGRCPSKPDLRLAVVVRTADFDPHEPRTFHNPGFNHRVVFGGTRLSALSTTDYLHALVGGVEWAAMGSSEVRALWTGVARSGGGVLIPA
jgi:hypothetical protein